MCVCAFVFVRLLLMNENGGVSVDHTHDRDGVLRNANSKICLNTSLKCF